MAHMCNTDTYLILALLLDDLLSFWQLMISHPLQCAYLLFFSPYLLQLISFLSPLLLSTFLLLLALLTVSPHLDDPPGAVHDLPGTASRFLVDILKSKLEEEEEKYFSTSLLHQLVTMILAEDELLLPSSVVIEEEEEESVVTCRQQGDDGERKMSAESLQREGSMRKEKEWKRTLACKLYEERMTFKLYEERKVAEGCEEMDLLWEAYEADSSKTADKPNKRDTRGKPNPKKEEEDDDEEEEENAGQVCCLQALRLSTGKMNFGIGSPHLTKISKAMKGMGFFRRARRRSIKESKNIR